MIVGAGRDRCTAGEIGKTRSTGWGLGSSEEQGDVEKQRARGVHESVR